MSRPQLTMNDLTSVVPLANFLMENEPDQETLEQAEIQIKYAGYIEKGRSPSKEIGSP